MLGDVNLFALTAREYAESGELNYPMKYDFSEKTVVGFTSNLLNLSIPHYGHSWPVLWLISWEQKILMESCRA